MGLRDLKEINFMRTNLDDEALAHIKTLPKLTGLTLTDTRITDEALANLCTT